MRAATLIGTQTPAGPPSPLYGRRFLPDFSNQQYEHCIIKLSAGLAAGPG